jgi:hypothetical protein
MAEHHHKLLFTAPITPQRLKNHAQKKDYCASILKEIIQPIL